MSALQRSLLSPELASVDHTEWVAIFGEVLFPLVLRLLKPEVYQSDPPGMSETRVHAATLVCKVFLHYMVLLSEWDGMLDLWLKILDILDRMMNSGQGDSLVCHHLTLATMEDCLHPHETSQEHSRLTNRFTIGGGCT